ncbi:MAG: signal recognition particle protein, partial [Catenulispora sp.]
LQGAGKTTLAGKLALHLKSQGHTPLLVAADLQRPNAVTQLQVVGERAGVPVFAPHPGNQGSDDVMPFGADPVAVAREGLATAKTKLHDVLIVDTAGRLGVDAELMQQAADIRDAVDPDEVLFVVDAMIGQDAVTTAQAFMDGVGFDGVVLTKLDGDARGGAALSVRQVTGKPVMFASSGEKLEDFDVFHPERMAGRILDMGDMLTLIEQAEKAFDAAEAEKMAGKLARNEFTMDDFLNQMEQLKKLGSMKKLMGMLPGMAEVKQQLNEIDDKDVDRLAAIMKSMTPAERNDVKIINGSRRQRIARGSGTTVQEVNNLIERFLESKKMMQQMARGGMPGMPGLPGMGGLGGTKRKSAKAKAADRASKSKGRSRSGNPAKAKAEEAARQARRESNGAFGDADGGGQFELPDDFKKLLPPQ